MFKGFLSYIDQCTAHQSNFYVGCCLKRLNMPSKPYCDCSPLQAYVHKSVMEELKRIIDDSEITKEDDALWPPPDRVGRQVCPFTHTYLNKYWYLYKHGVCWGKQSVSYLLCTWQCLAKACLLSDFSPPGVVTSVLSASDFNKSVQQNKLNQCSILTRLAQDGTWE